jgi:hypothetical protein
MDPSSINLISVNHRAISYHVSLLLNHPCSGGPASAQPGPVLRVPLILFDAGLELAPFLSLAWGLPSCFLFHPSPSNNVTSPAHVHACPPHARIGHSFSLRTPCPPWYSAFTLRALTPMTATCPKVHFQSLPLPVLCPISRLHKPPSVRQAVTRAGSRSIIIPPPLHRHPFARLVSPSCTLVVRPAHIGN